MKYLLSVCALFALLAVGCGEDTAVVDRSGSSSSSAPYSGPPGDVTEVDNDALASALAASELTLVDFTATW